MMPKQLLTEILLGPIGLFDGLENDNFYSKLLISVRRLGSLRNLWKFNKRVGAFAMALETINKCLSDAIYAMSRGRLDGDSRAAGLLHSTLDLKLKMLLISCLYRYSCNIGNLFLYLFENASIFYSRIPIL